MMDGIRVYEIGVNSLPSGANDIRGHVHNKPDRLYCWVEEPSGDIRYFGIVEMADLNA